MSFYSHSPYFNNQKKKVTIINNGFALGAQRFEPEIFPTGPDDCSTFIARYYDLPYMTTTAEQYLAYQISNGFYFTHLGEDVVRKWEEETYPKFSKDPTVNEIIARMSVMVVNDPTEVQPGWVSVEKKFSNFSGDRSIV